MEPMSETTTTEGTENAPEGGEQKQEKQEKTFTQAELDRIVKDRLAQQAKNQFPNYEEYKAAAEGAKTVEQKLADLEAKHAEAEARALRSEIATKHGISAEDRDLFLTGSDEATLDAQAKRLAERLADQKKTGNVARKEGDTTRTGDKEWETAQFAATLLGPR